MISKHRIEFLLFIFFGHLLSPFGFKSFQYTSKSIAFFFFNFIRIRRSVVITNLSIAFPNLSISEIKKLALKNYQSIAITFLEIFNSKKITRENMKERFSDAGFDFVREKYAENNGLILLTAHFGNWEYGAIACGVHLNENIYVLVKKQKNQFVADWLNGFREQFGNVQVPLGVSVRELYKTIKSKKIVGVVGDQRGKKDGVKINFFGRETSTFPGTAAIALKTKCPVIVLLCARQKNWNYEAVIEEIKTDDITGSTAEQVQIFNQRYMSILEKAIKKYPEQWLWMHNIWKY